MAWDKVNIKRDNGEIVEAQAPIIVSASRSTVYHYMLVMRKPGLLYFGLKIHVL